MGYVWSSPIKIDVMRPKGSITSIRMFIDGKESYDIEKGSRVQLFIVYKIDAPGEYRICYYVDNEQMRCSDFLEYTEVPKVDALRDSWVEKRNVGKHTITAELYAKSLKNPIDTVRITYNVVEKHTTQEEETEEEESGKETGEESEEELTTQTTGVGDVLTAIAGAVAAIATIAYFVKKKKNK